MINNKKINMNNIKTCNTDNNFRKMKEILVLKINPDITHLKKHKNTFLILY